MAQEPETAPEPLQEAVSVPKGNSWRSLLPLLAEHRNSAIAALVVFVVGAILRFGSLGHPWHYFVDFGGEMYHMHEYPAASLVAGHGLRQPYPSFPEGLPILVYPPAFALIIAALKVVIPPLDYEHGMIPSLAIVSFGLAVLGLWAVGAGWGRAKAFRAAWLSRPAGGALPPMLPVLIALAVLPPMVFYDLVPLGGAFAGILLLCGLFFLVRAQATRSMRSAAAAGFALSFSTWFRMETFPVIILVIAAFSLINVWRSEFAAVVRAVVIAGMIPLLLLSMYNYSVYRRFSPFPNAAHGLSSLLESCQSGKITTDAREGEMNWAGTFGGYYFPDPPAVGHNIMSRSVIRLFREFGIWKYAECGCNRVPEWMYGFEEGMRDIMSDSSGIRWQPLSLPLMILALTGLGFAALRHPASAYLLGATVLILIVQAFLAPWFTVYHIQHIMPLVVVGLVCLAMGIIQDVPRWLFGRSPGDATAAAIVIVLLSPFLLATSMADLGKPIDITRTPRYEVASDWRSLTTASGTTSAVGKVGKATVTSANFGRAQAGRTLSIDLEAHDMPPLSWIELHDAALMPATAQFRFALRHGERMASENHYFIHGDVPLPGWMRPGAYDVVMNIGSESAPLGRVTVEAPQTGVNLADNQASFFVPPPNWKDSGVTVARFSQPDVDHAKALGQVFHCLGWLATPEVLAYVDLGRARDVAGIVAHGSYGGWSGQAPDTVDFAVSDDGVRWKTLPRPRLNAVGDTPVNMSSFHVGVDGLRVHGRYVRARFATPASSSQGFTQWGLLRVNTGSVFVSGIDVYGR